MLEMIKNDVVRIIMTVRIQSREEIDAAEAAMQQPQLENVHYQHSDFDPSAAPEELLAPTSWRPPRAWSPRTVRPRPHSLHR